MKARSKDVSIGETTYSVGLLPAAEGAWIYTTFVARYRALASPGSKPEESTAEPTPVDMDVVSMGAASFMVDAMSREELRETMQFCLAVCGRYTSATGTNVALPVLMPNGKFALPDMEFDGPVCRRLLLECLAFNIAPYFTVAG